MSDVPRSLQSWVSTIHTVVLTADVFQLFIKNYHGPFLKRRTLKICTRILYVWIWFVYRRKSLIRSKINWKAIKNPTETPLMTEKEGPRRPRILPIKRLIIFTIYFVIFKLEINIIPRFWRRPLDHGFPARVSCATRGVWSRISEETQNEKTRRRWRSQERLSGEDRRFRTSTNR